ncbi:MAG: Asp23/Gls24 family envelope stress response protein [Lentisphaeria bacterium]|nr:Asp23/Gls24 family envelope stress response protein [Lentisphaeria bacterium]
MTVEENMDVNAPVAADSIISGDVRVHESVLASIARKSVLAVPGVIRLSGSSLIDNIAEIVGSRKTFDRAIVIGVSDEGITLEVRIIVKYGEKVPAVAAAVQKNIIDDITRLTGMNVVRADVVVMDLEDNAEVQEDAGTEESSVLSAASFVE